MGVTEGVVTRRLMKANQGKDSSMKNYYADYFDHYACIESVEQREEPTYRLVCFEQTGFVYFVSCYESMDEALQKLEEFSSGTFGEVEMPHDDLFQLLLDYEKATERAPQNGRPMSMKADEYRYRINEMVKYRKSVLVRMAEKLW